MTIATNETQALYQQIFLTLGKIVFVPSIEHISIRDISYGKHFSLFDSMLFQIFYGM